MAALLTATLPALLLFSPTTDQLYAALALLSLLWLHAGLQDDRPVFILLSGLAISLMTFFSLGNAVWGLLLVLYALWHWRVETLRLTDEQYNATTEQPSRQSMAKGVALFVLAACSLWLLFWLVWGLPPWAITLEGLQQHYALVTRWRRYDWWVLYNLLDFFLFAGPVVALGFAGQPLSAVRKAERRDEHILALLLIGMLTLLDFSGSTRGEVGRLWLVFMPLAAVLAACFLAQRLKSERWLTLLLAGQLLIALAAGFAWKPVLAVILPTPQPPAFANKQPVQRLDVILSDQTSGDRASAIRLLGFDLPEQARQPGETLNVTLYWQADRPVERPYTVFTHLVNSAGTLVAQQDNWPVQGNWPTTCWRASEVITDDYAMVIPSELSPGKYSLQIGMYDVASGIRLHTAEGQNTIHLGEVTIESDPE
jgi:hypothetical protein